MDQIVGKRSLLTQISVSAHYNLKELLGIKGREEISGDMLFDRQWGALEITNSTDYYINSMQATFVSIRDLATDTIDYYPEVAAYAAQELKTPVPPLPKESVKALFARAPTSQSLLNQVNVRNFYHYYENKDYASIKKRFGFTDNAQADALYQQLKAYPPKLVSFEEEGGSLQAAMMQRMLNLTMTEPYEKMMEGKWLTR